MNVSAALYHWDMFTDVTHSMLKVIMFCHAGTYRIIDFLVWQ
jgi:hypothetical protein